MAHPADREKKLEKIYIRTPTIDHNWYRKRRYRLDIEYIRADILAQLRKVWEEVREIILLDIDCENVKYNPIYKLWQALDNLAKSQGWDKE